MKSILYKISSILIITLLVSCTFKIENTEANDLTLSVTGNTATVNILQDGIDNDIELSGSSWVGGSLDVQQVGNNNDVDVTVTGGSGSGSSLNIYQTGNDKTYNSTLFCNHTWCTLTVNQ